MKGRLLMMMFLLACPMALLADDDPESAGLLQANGSYHSGDSPHCEKTV